MQAHSYPSLMSRRERLRSPRGTNLRRPQESDGRSLAIVDMHRSGRQDIDSGRDRTVSVVRLALPGRDERRSGATWRRPSSPSCVSALGTWQTLPATTVGRRTVLAAFTSSLTFVSEGPLTHCPSSGLPYRLRSPDRRSRRPTPSSSAGSVLHTLSPWQRPARRDHGR
jgi:hypothetical protein